MVQRYQYWHDGGGLATHLCSNYPRGKWGQTPPCPTNASILHKYEPSLELPDNFPQEQRCNEALKGGQVNDLHPTPRIALFVRALVSPLVTKFQPPGVLDASGVLDAA